MYKLLAVLLLLSPGVAIATDSPFSYDQVKPLADHDGAALIAPASKALVASQGRLWMLWRRSADAPVLTEPFRIVTELDATGRRKPGKGSSDWPCFENHDGKGPGFLPRGLSRRSK